MPCLQSNIGVEGTDGETVMLVARLERKDRVELEDRADCTRLVFIFRNRAALGIEVSLLFSLFGSSTP